MTFSEQLSADIALIEPALEGYLSRETHEGYDRIFEAAELEHDHRAASACVR